MFYGDISLKLHRLRDKQLAEPHCHRHCRVVGSYCGIVATPELQRFSVGMEHDETSSALPQIPLVISDVQLLLQPSPSFVLPSSHCSTPLCR